MRAFLTEDRPVPQRLDAALEMEPAEGGAIQRAGDRVAAAAMFGWNLLTLPVSVVRQPPWQGVTSR